MKRILLISMLLIAFAKVAFTQTQDAFNYQAVIRDESGELVKNKAVSFKISILSESVDGEEVYSETHHVFSDSFGGVVLQIGAGAPINGTFSEINWGNNLHFVQTALDLENGPNFEVISTTQLLSVPYALYAQNSGDKVWDSNNSNISYNAGTVGINNSNPIADLDIIGDGTDRDILALRNNDYARYAAYAASNSDPFAIPAFVGFKSRGTVSAPTNVASQDRLTGLYGGMYVNGQYRISSAVEMFAGNSPGTNDYPSYIKFGTTPENGTLRQERMRIDENGNVGIGTTNPQYPLHIETDNDANLLFRNSLNSSIPGTQLLVGNKTDGFAGLYLDASDGDFVGLDYASLQQNNDLSLRLINRANAPIFFGTNGNNSQTIKMTIAANGNVGVGTQDPNAKVQVSNGDVYIEDINRGIIMTSPNGQCWRVTVDDSGQLVSTATTCPN